MLDEDHFRRAGASVNETARTLTPPDAAAARTHQRRHARKGMAAAAIGVLVVLLLVAGAASRGGGPDTMALSAGSPGGTTPGSTPGSVLGTTPPSTITPGTTAPTTTVLAPTTTTTTSPLAEPSTEQAEGTYTGIGHYAVFTEQCADISQTLDATFVLTDGSTWTYQSAFCASTDDNDVWRGAGPFTLTVADGATLTGDFTSTAQLPTDGVPYSLRITGGTQRYAGATGSCALTVALRETAFGEQAQSGTFACNVTR